MSWLNRPPAQGLIATGIADPSVFARNGLLLSVNAKRDYGASGSSQSTTGTMAAASTTLTLAAALDFVNGQGIAIANAGPVPSLTVPGAPTATVVGTAGTSTYNYSIAALDGLGGGTAAGPGAGVTTGPAVLSATNYVSLTWAAVAGVKLYAIYRYQATGSPSTTGLIAVVSGTSFNDIGVGVIPAPFGVSGTATPTAAFGDTLLTSIVSGAGTASLVLANAATTAVTGTAITHDDSSALQSFINGLAAGQLGYMPGDSTYQVFTGLTISSQINLICDGVISFMAATGVAVTVMPSPAAGSNYNSRIQILGISQNGGTNGEPQGVSANGASGIQINQLIQGIVELGYVDNFTNIGVFLDGQGEINANPQVIAHSTISITQIANCGYGLLALSKSAATSNVEANRITVIWMLQCYIDLQLDNSTSSGATSSNYFNIVAIDNAYLHGVLCYGSYNLWDLAYLGTDLVFETGAQYNTVRVGNSVPSGATLTNGGTGNKVSFATPLGALTAPAVPASGTALVNPFGVDCTVAVTDSGTGTSVAVGGITVATIAAGATVPVRVGAGQSITLTYSTTPTWAWTGH